MLYKKIFFSVILLATWYYLMAPYFKNFQAYRDNVKKIPTDNINLFRPKSGRDVLPEEAQLLLIAIDSFKFKDYKLYKSLGGTNDGIGNAAEIYQRINESAWPVPLDTNSRNVIGYTNEVSEIPGIKILLQYNNVSIGTY